MVSGKKKYDLSKMTVCILGMSFKANIDDTRSSLSYKLKKMLTINAKNVINHFIKLMRSEVKAYVCHLILSTYHWQLIGLSLQL